MLEHIVFTQNSILYIHIILTFYCELDFAVSREESNQFKIASEMVFAMI